MRNWSLEKLCQEAKIRPGAIFTWYSDPNITAEYAGGDLVKYEGKKTSLRQIARALMDNPPTTRLCWQYNGKTLREIKNEITG